MKQTYKLTYENLKTRTTAVETVTAEGDNERLCEVNAINYANQSIAREYGAGFKRAKCELVAEANQ